MASNHEVNYNMKVPVAIYKTLNKILRKSEYGITFEKLVTLFEKKHKGNLNLSVTENNDIVLVIDQINSTNFRKMMSNSETHYSEEGIAELTNYFKKVNFTSCELNQLKNISSSSFHSDKYITIKLENPFTKSCTNIEYKSEENLENPDLPNFFNIWNWKECNSTSLFVVSVYDPSKFWIRIGSIDIFQKNLWEFCTKKGKDLLLNKSDIYVGLNCVALISDLYYRGRIVRTDLSNNEVFRIFLYDFGILSTVHISQLYYLHHPFGTVPAFAVRARLFNISSIDNKMWKSNVINRFVELTENKPLSARIALVHKSERVLLIELFDDSITDYDKVPSINYILVSEGLAKNICDPPVLELKEISLFKPLRKHLFLLPTFEMIENGTVLTKIELAEHLEKVLGCNMAWDVVFPHLFQYDCTE